MSKAQIKLLIENTIKHNGMVETAIKGVHIFRVTEPVPCTPVVYEPTIIAIVSGAKEAILDGSKHSYDANHYLCCTQSMPIEAGVPNASSDTPLLGVMISLDTKVMTELAIAMDSTQYKTRLSQGKSISSGLTLARWDSEFSSSLLRLLQLNSDAKQAELLGEGRLRELYYAIFKGDAGKSAQQAFAAGNEVTKAINYLNDHLDQPVTIDEMASNIGVSRAVLHRKFKQATTLSPIQFMKSMRLNNAAMKIAGGMKVSQAAMQVGYVSSSQFSREFKRLYGKSPKQWISA